jgi:hypothetical protein
MKFCDFDSSLLTNMGLPTVKRRLLTTRNGTLPPELLSQVKLVVSSRPEPIYCDTFEDHPQLWMERLTHDDITADEKDRIEKHIHKSQATSDRVEDVQRLVQEIV